MEILRKFIVALIMAAAMIAMIAVFLLISNKGGDFLQSTRNFDISATMSNYRVSHEPHGPAGKSFHSGEHVYFSLDVLRPEDCMVDVDYRIARIDAPDAHTIWVVEGARAAAAAINKLDHVSQNFTLPDNMTPGHYSLTRLSGWQCGNAKVPAMNLMMVNFDVVADDQPTS